MFAQYISLKKLYRIAGLFFLLGPKFYANYWRCRISFQILIVQKIVIVPFD